MAFIFRKQSILYNHSVYDIVPHNILYPLFMAHLTMLSVIILKWIFRMLDVEVWTGSSWLRIGTCGGYF